MFGSCIPSLCEPFGELVSFQISQRLAIWSTGVWTLRCRAQGPWMSLQVKHSASAKDLLLLKHVPVSPCLWIPSDGSLIKQCVRNRLRHLRCSGNPASGVDSEQAEYPCKHEGPQLYLSWTVRVRTSCQYLTAESSHRTPQTNSARSCAQVQSSPGSTLNAARRP